MPLNALADFITTFRREMDDPELPGSGDDSDSLWSDEEITAYVYEAQQALCEEVDILVDRSSFSIDVTDGTSLYALDDRITKVRRGKGEDNRDIPAISIRELERRYQIEDLGWNEDYVSTWEDKTGPVQYLVTDFSTGYLRPVPLPEVDETIALDVYRLPEDSTLEIPVKYRRELLHKVKELAYRKPDVDSEDIKRADAHELRWLKAVRNIDKKVKRGQRGVQVVSYGGIEM